jgi:hypothetical protein
VFGVGEVGCVYVDGELVVVGGEAYVCACFLDALAAATEPTEQVDRIDGCTGTSH